MSFCKLPWVKWIITKTLNTKLTPNYAQRSANNWSFSGLLEKWFSTFVQAYKHQTKDGGLLSLGLHQGGEGVFDTDPMQFAGGSDINCGGVERSTEAYWYCWYNAYPNDKVSLDHV